MADIFISYSKSHRSLTEELATELEAEGYSVWWDTSLVAGESFREVIVAELAQTRAAIVIWSSASVKSSWVISEATRAQKRGILIPVRAGDLDPDDIPPPFDVLHTEIVSNRAAILAALAKRNIRPTTKSSPTQQPMSEVAEAVALARPESATAKIADAEIATPRRAEENRAFKPSIAKSIGVAAVVILILGGLIVGTTRILSVFALVASFAIEQGVYAALMVAGWTAWVCFCALVYMVFERLFPNFLGPSSENG